ncbi:cation diffusion facilitator CzcD-associated flavoprotein CzcO [Methylovorus glucosotrophus]|uniref:NAD(P)-binding domain-containing protein n=1 Tax=Methylovorus glucosotrophus TaxID=266009 RepID=UPI0013317660|nr:NAD(P)-binding domain-containing protein [Methylovorus glucosotrophus]KAF0842857.1 cation diffusion facilitator CzcD-associated flavoprotein CzcO [Methylovorus glucosotrophus]
MNTTTEVTIVGAGPYGLSIAAHLRHMNVNFRIIGSPMHTWRTHMPKGMHLKSAGLSATLFDPEHSFTLKQYCRQNNIPYEDEGLPISLELFTQYGMAFQRRFAPNLEETKLQCLRKQGDMFELVLENGSTFLSRKVILAVGIDYFRYLPQPLDGLDKSHYSHSAEHHDLEKFRGKEVVVIGSGSSAIDMAVLLHEIEAKPILVARRQALNFGQKEGRVRTRLSRLVAPMSGLGPGWKNLFCAAMPGLFRYLPANFRVRVVKEFLGPSGGWFIKPRMKDIPILLGYKLLSAKSVQGKAELQFIDVKGEQHSIQVEHVIAATGYKAQVNTIRFLAPEIELAIQLIDKTPRLSANFESSVPGLYFAGPSTANTFGPVMRFALGAGFASRTISRHLHRVLRQHPTGGQDTPVRQSIATSQYQR